MVATVGMPPLMSTQRCSEGAAARSGSVIRRSASNPGERIGADEPATAKVPDEPVRAGPLARPQRGFDRGDRLFDAVRDAERDFDLRHRARLLRGDVATDHHAISRRVCVVTAARARSSRWRCRRSCRRSSC
ncbi:MAG: hypothetical protein ACU0CO_03720, partial [Shimia sp.]